MNFIGDLGGDALGRDLTDGDLLTTRDLLDPEAFASDSSSPVPGNRQLLIEPIQNDQVNTICNTSICLANH